MNPSCALCIYGNQLGILADDPVFCGPQKNVRAAGYVCTGYKQMTAELLMDHQRAQFGRPVVFQSKPDSGTDSEKNAEVLKSSEVTAADGAPGGIRTHDQLIKSQIKG